MTLPLSVVVVADVSPLVVRGGSERVVWEQSRRLAARGHRVCVVSRLPEDAGAPPARREGVAFHNFAVKRRPASAFIHGSILGARRAVAQVLRAQGADVLHFHQPLSAFGALTSPEARCLPSLYTFHSPAPLEYRGRRGTSALHRDGVAGRAGAALLGALERWTLARVTRIHVLSDYSATLLRTLYGIEGDRVVKIPGAADTVRFEPPAEGRGGARRALGWPTDRRLLLTVRNLEPRMGLDELVLALDRLRRQLPDVLLLIGGDGSLRSELAAQIRRLDLADHVRLLGFVPEAKLPRCYGAVDAFVLPTQALEGFGLVTVEALACGTPVLGTPVGATPEILGPLSKSLVLGGTTAPVLAEDIGRFLEQATRDPAGAEALRRACRLHVEAHYRWGGAVDRLEATLAGIAERSPGEERCRVCGGPLRADLTLRTRTYRRCRACATGMVSVLPPHEQIRQLYEVEYPRRFDHAAVPATRTRLFQSIARALTRLRSPGRVLDVGCSGGHFLTEAARLGWRGVGSDLSGEACAVTRTVAGCPSVQADGGVLPVRDATLDAVALLGIVDLTTDPLATVREAHRVLVPGGILVIRVTNAAFHRPIARALGVAAWLGRVVPLRPVLHVFAFSARGIRTLVERAGFEVVTVRNSLASAQLGTAPRARHRALAALRALLPAGAAGVAAVSGGRWLLAPSIELYARRPLEPGAPRS